MLPRNTPMVSKMSQTVCVISDLFSEPWLKYIFLETREFRFPPQPPNHSRWIFRLSNDLEMCLDKGSKPYSREIVSLMPLCLFSILVFFSSHVQRENVSVGCPDSPRVWEVSTSLSHLLALLLDLLVLSSVSWHLARRSPKDCFPYFPRAPWCLPSALQEWRGLQSSYLMATVVSFTMS